MPSTALDIVFWIKKTNLYGLSQDIRVFEYAIRELNKGMRTLHFHTKDPLEPPIPADINIHIEIPVYVAVPWASVNILMVNPEWYTPEWDGYISRFDALLVRDQASKTRFAARFPDLTVECIPWCLPPRKLLSLKGASTSPKDGFVWFVAGSQNKRRAVEWMVPHWKENYPPLTICSVEPFPETLQQAANVRFITKDLSEEERLQYSLQHPGQVCISTAEAFGYGTAEAEQVGAWMLLNNLDVYVQDYTNVQISTPLCEKSYARVLDVSGAFPEDQLEAALNAFQDANFVELRENGVKQAEARRKATLVAWQSTEFWRFLVDRAMDRKETKPKHLPPVLMPDDCPPISIITLLYNRRKFFDLACHNIMLSDYPKDKIEWIVVEDSDDPNEDASDRVIQVGLKAAPLQLAYMPLGKKTPIGEKRNKGIEKAKHDIILFMDDDDHYPETSLRRRVAWLTKHPMKPKCVACTTIAAYDLLRGVSAVNSPPFDLSLGKRISEATMAFYRSWWETKKFAADELSEGEHFLQGREAEVLELPPQQIIVAFSHKKNTSGRRIPADDAKPGCFWGFPKEYLVYIHKLAGVEVEEEK